MALFIFIWLAHYNFFRRYGLHDTATMWINFALLFTVLLYIYPLKFLFTFAAGKTAPGVFSNPYQQRDLVIIYGAGFAAVQLCFAALYGNAWRKRDALRLSPLETTLTLVNFWNYIGIASVGLICCLIAMPPSTLARERRLLRLLPPHRLGTNARFHLLPPHPPRPRPHLARRPRHLSRTYTEPA